LARRLWFGSSQHHGMATMNYGLSKSAHIGMSQRGEYKAHCRVFVASTTHTHTHNHAAHTLLLRDGHHPHDHPPQPTATVAGRYPSRSTDWLQERKWGICQYARPPPHFDRTNAFKEADQALVLTILLSFREDLIGWVPIDFGSCESLVCVASPQYCGTKRKNQSIASHSDLSQKTRI